MKRLPTWVEVDLDLLDHNIDLIRRHVGDQVKVLLTVKADAYGHGAVQVAQAVEKKVDLFGVATIDEAAELREAGVAGRILILSPILETEIPSVVEGRFAVTISSYGIAHRLSEVAQEHKTTVDAHIEIDTGMGRTGISEKYGREEIRRIAFLPGLKLAGVYTHFPVSDSDDAYTRDQIVRLNKIVESLRADGLDIPIVHSANSAAVSSIGESHMDMIRPGLLAYGLESMGDSRIGVEPILTWKSRLVRTRRIPAGHSISYGRTFVTGRESVIGVLPVGYGHGLPFRASDGGHFLVGGCRVPIVGRVTMDMTMMDLTDLKTIPPPGEEVVLVGRQGDEIITFDDVARWSGTISYEVMCGISKRVPRTYFREGRVETYKSLLGILPKQISI